MANRDGSRGSRPSRDSRADYSAGSSDARSRRSSASAQGSASDARLSQQRQQRQLQAQQRLQQRQAQQSQQAQGQQQARQYQAQQGQYQAQQAQQAQQAWQAGQPQQQGQYRQQPANQQQAWQQQQAYQQQPAQYQQQPGQQQYQRQTPYPQQSVQYQQPSQQHYQQQRGAAYGAYDARGVEDAGDYSRASYEQQYTQKKRRRNPVPIIIAAIVVVLVLAGGAFALNRFVLNPPQDPQPSASPSPAAPTPAEKMAVAEKEGGQQVGAERIAMAIKGDDETIVFKGEDYIESGCTATDKVEGNITDKVQISGKVDTSKVGDYEITYKVKNSEGMERSRTRTVHVVDDLEKNTGGIPVCMYHYIYAAGDEPEALDSNYILDTDLEEQLQYLADNNYYYPSFSELRAWIDGTHSLPSNCIILTFDDGEPGFLKYGTPLFEKYGVCITSFLVCSDNIEPMTEWASDYISFQSHSYDMHHGGGNIGHGGVVSAMTQEEIRDDLQKSVDMLGEKDAYAYPYGDTTEEAQAAVSQVGFLCAFTTEFGSVHQGDDVTLLPRIRVQGGNSLDSFIASV